MNNNFNNLLLRQYVSYYIFYWHIYRIDKLLMTKCIILINLYKRYTFELLIRATVIECQRMLIYDCCASHLRYKPNFKNVIQRMYIYQQSIFF